MLMLVAARAVAAVASFVALPVTCRQRPVPEQIIGAKWREMTPAQKQEWLDAEEEGKKAFQAASK